MEEFKDLGAKIEGEGEKPRGIISTVIYCYRHAWRQLWKYFAKFLLILVVFIIVSLPINIIISIISEILNIGIIGIISGIIYGILVGWPLQVGFYFVCFKISRGEELKVKDLFCVFKNFKNYGNVLLSLLLMNLIVLVGFIFLIIPGIYLACKLAFGIIACIYLACKLAFVPYLVVDRGMGAIASISTSWRMTKGYAITVFLIWLLALPVVLAGVICLIVGVIPASMWIGIAYATLYYVVSKRGEVSNMTKLP